jgi:hypothetical protein
MYGMKKIFSVLLAVFSVITSFSQVVADTVLHARDSVIEDMTMDCNTAFFERSERVSSLGKTKIQTKEGKLMTMTAFLASQDMSAESQHAVIDLDKDGKKELVIFNYTGGAHCCDEYYFFKNTGVDKYQFAGKTFGGDVCITDSNRFDFYFYESFGYFFTCFACLYTDESDEAPIPVGHITLYYQKGKLLVEKGNQELKNLINDNLAKLGEQPYQKLEEEVDHDNGLRKEFAKNLAVYYYSYGKNLPQTQALFNKYYKHPDAKKVWAAFVQQLQYLKKDNNF